MQCDCTRERISRHVENGFKGEARFVPIPDMVTIKFAQVSERRRIRRIHFVSCQIKLFGSQVTSAELCSKTSDHSLFDQRTLLPLKHRGLRNVSDRYGSELIQLLRRILGILREHAFLD